MRLTKEWESELSAQRPRDTAEVPQGLAQHLQQQTTGKTSGHGVKQRWTEPRSAGPAPPPTPYKWAQERWPEPLHLVIWKTSCSSQQWSSLHLFTEWNGPLLKRLAWEAGRLHPAPAKLESRTETLNYRYPPWLPAQPPRRSRFAETIFYLAAKSFFLVFISKVSLNLVWTGFLWFLEL